MKYLTSPFRVVLHASISILLACSSLWAQNKINLSIGAGIPELVNIGARYQLEQTQLGIGFGVIPLKNETLVSVLTDASWHFWGFSELTERRPWFGRMGLNYMRDETKTFIEEFLFLNLRIGRDLNFSKKFGMDIGAGIIIQLLEAEKVKTSSDGWNLDPDFSVLPGFGLGFFYRL